MRVMVFDYGAGNLHSLLKALTVPGVNVMTETDPARAVWADALVLPGVGAFGAAAARLSAARQTVRDALDDGLPCLGICLGMQLLFDASEEGAGMGLGIIPGRVTRVRARRVPHIGWNTIDDACDPLLTRMSMTTAYYANGYACRPMDTMCVRAWSTHESDRFAAVVRRGNTVGVQFHPEKSSTAGVAFVRAFLEEARS